MLKMKKTILLVILFSFLNTLAFGQGFYFKAGGGYSVAVSKRRVPSYAFDLATSGNGYNHITNLKVEKNVVTADDEIEDSYGKGASVQLGAGYAFNKYVAIEADFVYLWGGRIKPDIFEINALPFDFRTKMQSFIFHPSFKISPDVPGPWKPYAGLGAMLFFGSNIKSKVQVNDFGGTVVFKDEVKKDVAFGPSGTLGIDYFLNDHVSVFGEASVFLAAYTPKVRQIKEYSVAGNDLLFLFPSTEWELKKEISVKDDFNQFDEAYTMPLSGLSFNIGVKYSITR